MTISAAADFVDSFVHVGVLYSSIAVQFGANPSHNGTREARVPRPQLTFVREVALHLREEAKWIVVSPPPYASSHLKEKGFARSTVQQYFRLRTILALTQY
jgi:hypothetical protein